MPSQGGNGGQGGPWGSRDAPPDIDALLRQWQARLKQFLPSGNPSGLIIVVGLAVAGLLAWTAHYTVPSDSVAVVQRFGKYLKDVPAGIALQIAVRYRCRDDCPRQAAIEAGIRLYDPGRHAIRTRVLAMGGRRRSARRRWSPVT
jgi:hypothetical protein